MKIQKKLKKAIILLSIIFFVFLFSGCWNRRELNTLAVVGLIGTDVENDNLKLTFEIYKAKKSNVDEEKKGSTKCIQSTGKSVYDAIRNVNLKTGRKLLFSTAKVYVFDEATAKKGLTEYIDFWMRDHEPREDGYILIAKNVPASDICSAKIGMEDSVADFLERLVENQKSNSKVVAISVRDFLKTYYSQGVHPVVGIVQKSNNKIDNDDELSDEGSAVFKKDKLVGFMNGYETRGYNWVIGKVKSGIVVSSSLDGKGTNSVEIIKASSHNYVEITGNNIVINVKVTMLGMLGEETGKLNLNEPEIVNLVADASSKVIKIEIEDVIKKTQNEYEEDIFGFGQVMHREYPDRWKKIKDNWDEVYSNAEVNVVVKTNIQRTGLSNIPAVGKGEN